MTSFSLIETAITLITLTIAYFFAMIVSNIIQSKVAAYFGDYSARAQGFESLSPLKHVDAIGYACLLIFRFGWWPLLPINPQYIRAPHKYLKLFLVYLVQPLTLFIFSFISLAISLFAFGTFLTNQMAASMVSKSYVSISEITSLFNEYSSGALAMALLLIAIVWVCMVEAAWTLILGAFRFMTQAYFVHTWYGYQKNPNFELILSIITFAALILIVPYVRILFLSYSLSFGYIFARCCGVV